MGIGLHYLDSGLSYEELMKLAIDARLGPGATHRQVVDLLYSNITGSLPSDTTASSFEALLDTGAQTVGSLGVLAADTALNASNIDLVGISDTGLLYSEYAG